MAETITREQMREQREGGDEFQMDDDGRRSIEGLDALVAQLRALTEAQRANAGADMLRSETQAKIIETLQKIVARPSGESMTQEVLEELVEQLSEREEREPNPVYVFDIERNQTTGYIQKITATPQPSGGAS